LRTMREPWSSRLAILAAVAATQAYVATTGNAADAGAPLAGFAPECLCISLAGLAERGTQAWVQLTHLI
jgi:hypothetical protein